MRAAFGGGTPRGPVGSMKLLHRYLLLELVQDAFLTLVTVLALYFMVAMALTLGTSRAENLPVTILLEYTFYQAVANLYLTLPLTVLTASIFTYGRATAEGEFTAIRAAGIHPYQALLPALLLGCVCTFSLAWLQDEVMPAAHFRTRTEITRDVLRNLESLLRRSDKRVQDERWTASWEELAQNERGEMILKDLTVIRLDKQRNPTTTLRASQARPALDDLNKQLTLSLHEVWITEGEQEWPTRMLRMNIALDLESLSSRSTKGKRLDDRSYEELLSGARFAANSAARLEARRPGDPKEAELAERHAKAWVKRGRKSRSEYHMRIAFAFAPLIFGFFGAALGLRKALANRALVFLAGFLILVAVYYPLVMFGKWIGTEGYLPPVLALWIGNVAMVAMASWIYRGVVRT